ncbi:hypothetical protein VNI00_004309 [Paramarasmius palmivorus]|uniref:DUF6534 domain-containing protein n=1 Tax=Paramarasmius palmivorus TaxID=297713 RepID=A0AAW0DL56_9AGAR
MTVGNIDRSSSADEISALTDVPMFLGNITSCYLMGAMTVQVFMYYLSFRHDTWYLKLTVWVLFFAECLSSVFATVDAVEGFVKGFLTDSARFWPFKALGSLCGLEKLPGLIVESSTHQADVTTTVILWLAGNIVCDIVISITLTVLLRKVIFRLKSNGPRARMERLIAIAIETGMITVIGSLLELVFFFVFRQSLIYFTMVFLLPKLYANCMMATLNSRIVIPGQDCHESTVRWVDVASNGDIQLRTATGNWEQSTTGFPTASKDEEWRRQDERNRNSSPESPWDHEE